MLAAERGESDAQYDMSLRCWTGTGIERDATTAASAAVCAAVFGVVKSRVRFRRDGRARKKSGARRASWLNWLINVVYFLGQD